MKGRGFNESKKTKTKQNKTKRNTRERQHDICKPNARRIQVWTTCDRPTMASEPARTRLLWTILSLVLPVTPGRATACRSPVITFSAAIHFAMKRPDPCSTVLRHSPWSWAAVVHWLALIPKALRLSTKRPIHYFSRPLTQSTPPTSYPNMTHFGSLASSMRATNRANKICLLRIIASMLSFPVLLRVSRYEIGWSLPLFFRQLMQRVRQPWWLGAACRSGTRASST